MNRSAFARIGTSVLVLALALSFSLGQKAKHKPAAPAMPYSKISGLIKEECIQCHNAKGHAAGIDVSTYSALMKANIVTPGHPEKSKLIMYVDGQKQPRMPMRKAPLTAAQITLLKNWILAGAKS